MARNFVAASSQQLENTNALVTAAPLTLACWFKPASTGTARSLVNLKNSASGATLNQFRLGYNASDQVIAFCADGSSANSGIGGTISSGTWFHGAAVFASATSRTAYLNGTAGTANTTSRTPSGVNRTRIGVQDATLYMDGDIAEVGIWNVALSTSDIAQLAAGVTPRMVRPDALVNYFRLIGRDSPEPDLRGALDLTVTGATQSAHPRMYYSGRGTRSVFVPSLNQTLTSGTVSVTTGGADPTVTPGAVTVASGTAAVTESVSAPTTAPGALSLTSGVSAVAESVSDPTLTPVVSLASGTVAETVSVSDPSAVPGASFSASGTASVSESVVDPAVTPGSVTVASGTAAVTCLVSDPTTTPTISLGSGTASETVSVSDPSPAPGVSTLSSGTAVVTASVSAPSPVAQTFTPGRLAKPPRGTLLRRGHPLAKNLRLAWTFDGGPSTPTATIKDHSGRGKNGTGTGLGWGSGVYGRCPTFDGSAGRVVSGANPFANNPSDNFTFAVGFRPTSLPQSAALIGHSIDNGSSTFNGVCLMIGDGSGNSGSTLQVLYSGVSYYATGLTLTAGAINNALIVRRAGTLYAYLNGRTATLVTTNGPTAPGTNATAAVGAQTTSGSSATRFFDGAVEYGYIWHRALTDREVRALQADPFRMFRRRDKAYLFRQAAAGGQTLAAGTVGVSVTGLNPGVSPGAVSLSSGVASVSPAAVDPSPIPGGVTLAAGVDSVSASVSDPTPVAVVSLTPGTAPVTVSASDPTLTPGASPLTSGVSTSPVVVSDPSLSPGASSPGAGTGSVTVSVPDPTPVTTVALTSGTAAETVTVIDPTTSPSNSLTSGTAVVTTSGIDGTLTPGSSPLSAGVGVVNVAVPSVTIPGTPSTLEAGVSVMTVSVADPTVMTTMSLTPETPAVSISVVNPGVVSGGISLPSGTGMVGVSAAPPTISQGGLSIFSGTASVGVLTTVPVFVAGTVLLAPGTASVVVTVTYHVVATVPPIRELLIDYAYRRNAALDFPSRAGEGDGNVVDMTLDFATVRNLRLEF